MSGELKLCPFCGAEEITAVRVMARHYSASCRSCGAGATGDTMVEAVEAWNRRAPDEALKQALQQALAERDEAKVWEKAWETRCAHVEAVASRLSRAAWRVIHARDAFRSPSRTSHPNLVLEEAEAWVELRAVLDGSSREASAATSVPSQLEGEKRGGLCPTCHGTRRIHIVEGCTTPAHDRDCPVCVGWPIGGGLNITLSEVPK